MYIGMANTITTAIHPCLLTVDALLFLRDSAWLVGRELVRPVGVVGGATFVPKVVQKKKNKRSLVSPRLVIVKVNCIKIGL